MAKALIIIDMQKDFVTGELGTREAQEMLPRLVKKLEDIVEEGAVDLIFTQDTHADNYLDTQEGKNLPVVHCIKGTKGHELAPALQEYAKQAKAVVEKGAFGSPKLAEMLAGYDEIELMGLCTDICVIANAMLLKSFYPETKIAVDAACSAGVTPESHANALAAMKMCQIEIKGK